MSDVGFGALDDGELVARVRARGYEKTLGKLGCVVAALASTVPAAGVAGVWTRDIGGLIGSVAHGLVFVTVSLCSFPFVALLFGPLIALRRLRARKEIAELRRRWGQEDLSNYERRAAFMLASGGHDDRGRAAPDFIVLFQGRELPAGRHRFLRLDLWAGVHVLAEAEVRRAHPVLDAADADPPSSLSLIRRDVPAPLAEAIAQKLAGIDGDIPASGSSTRGGFPCRCAVLRREPSDVFHAEANLAVLASSHPAAALLGLLVAVTEALVSSDVPEAPVEPDH